MTDLLVTYAIVAWALGMLSCIFPLANVPGGKDADKDFLAVWSTVASLAPIAPLIGVAWAWRRVWRKWRTPPIPPAKARLRGAP